MTSPENPPTGRIVPRVARAVGRFAKAAEPVDLPVPRPIDLPDRGRTGGIDAPRPEGAPTVTPLHAFATTAALSWSPPVHLAHAHYSVIPSNQRSHRRGIQSDHFR